MRNPFNHLAITVFFLIVIHHRGLAQTDQQPPARQAFRVEGLTADDRDMIARQLAIDGDFRIAFACVPAGIVVIEAVRVNTGQAASQSMTARVRAGAPARMPVPDDRSMTELEETCSAARNK